MKAILKNIAFFLLFSLSIVQHLSAVEIRIETDDSAQFENRTYREGALLYTNRIYTLVNTNKQFDGFDMLVSNGGEIVTGSIIPLQSGYVYVLARSGISFGWEELPDTKSLIFNADVSIYRKEAVAEQPIQIPQITNFQGVTPLARRIVFGPPKVHVVGNLIDIVDSVAIGNSIFVQNNDYSISTLPDFLENMNCSFSTSDRAGVTSFSASDLCVVYVGINYKPTILNGWKFTGEEIKIKRQGMRVITLYVYRYDYNKADVEVAVLRSTATLPSSSLFFAEKIERMRYPKAPGTVITRSLSPKNTFITNPSLAILPSGEYVASCTGAYRVQGTKAGVSFFLSKDKGVTWQTQSTNNGVMSYQNLFVFEGQLYVMGTNGVQKDIVIKRSDDMGVTWTEPADSKSGLLLQGQYHSAPVPMIEHDGRIWRAFETNFEGEKKRTFVLSAPVDADLMDAGSWVTTNEIAFEETWINDNGRKFKQWLEGNVVVDQEGNLLNILRVDEEKEGGVAAVARVSSPYNIDFNPSEDIISFPGGGKKFTIRHDPVTNKYWTISNAEFDEDRNKTQDGIYKNGTHCGLLRSRAVLMCSDDLRNWEIRDTLLSSDNPFLHGFQYIDWHFDGKDIVAVSRTAYDDFSGLPVRQHDANLFLFHRFQEFRGDLVSDDSQQKLTSKSPLHFDSQNRIVVLNTNGNVDLMIYSLAGQVLRNEKNYKKRLVDLNVYPKGVYLLFVKGQGEIFKEKIILK